MQNKVTKKIKCYGINGEEEFEISHNFNDDDFEKTFIVHSIENSWTDNYFELILEIIDSKKYWSKSMKHTLTADFSKKGVPEATLKYASKYLDSTIRSTKKISDDLNYWRTREATAVWNRLVSTGDAEYIKEEDYYETLVKSQTSD